MVVNLAVVAFSWSLKSENGGLALAMFKTSSVAFGNGFALLPLIQSETVDAHHWMTMSQFADGIALGRIRPSSILITATFVGYKLDGFWGGLLTAFGACILYNVAKSAAEMGLKGEDASMTLPPMPCWKVLNRKIN